MEKQSLDVLLIAMLGNKELADRWWYSPNRAFDMQRPIDVDVRVVRRYLMNHAFGYGGK